MVWAWKAMSRHFFQPLAPKVVVSTKKIVSLPKSALFGPKVPLAAPLRKTLYKHKHLEGVLGAQSRKSALLAQKVRNSVPKPDFQRKVRFGREITISAKRRETSRNVTYSALKACPRLGLQVVASAGILRLSVENESQQQVHHNGNSY